MIPRYALRATREIGVLNSARCRLSIIVLPGRSGAQPKYTNGPMRQLATDHLFSVLESSNRHTLTDK